MDKPYLIGIAEMEDNYGIYAFRIHGIGGPKDIMSADCTEIVLDDQLGIWYRIHNTRNVIHEVERWAYVPPHAILLIAFNEKPKANDNTTSKDKA